MKNCAKFIVVLIVCSCRVSILQAVDPKTANARAEHIKQMSQIERDRFDRNLKDFQRLNEADKQHYRQLHQELLDDNARGGGLSKLLQTYSIWVQTLTPTQREELQKETVVSQKLALIRRFKDEQDEPSEAQDHQSQPDEAAPRASSPINKREAFPLRDLKGVIAVLVNRISPDKMKPDFNEPRVSDYVPIVHASVQSYGGNYLEWPSEALLKDMTAALSKESNLLISRQDYKSRRETMVRFLLMSIMKQAGDSVRMPSESEKVQILEGLSPAERDRIMNLPRDRRDGNLIRKSMELKGGEALEAYTKLPEYSSQILDLFQRLEVAPPVRFLQRVKRVTERPVGESKRLGVNRANRNPGDQ